MAKNEVKLTPTGGPAFPCERPSMDHGPPRTIVFTGMSLRDWFAGKALNGLVANRLDQAQNLIAAAMKMAGINPLKVDADEFAKDNPEIAAEMQAAMKRLWKDLAEQCFEAADAMIEARDKQSSVSFPFSEGGS